MLVSYCFSSDKGDVTVDDALLDSPFAVGPSEYHPFMTLRDFFDVVRDALLLEQGEPLASWLSGKWEQPVTIRTIERIVVRYEKYGTLYQVCSVEITARGRSARICATVALSAFAQQTLRQEMGHLKRLQQDDDTVAYLPRLFWSTDVKVRKDEQEQVLLIAFLEWFEDYHEWHFAARPDGSARAYIWDMQKGYRLASAGETGEIIRQASKILSFYYDFATASRVAPWHHGGGDFVMKAGPAGIGVKLITVRGYGPSAPVAEPMIALLAFFLCTVTKMRLDKWEGMGESTWAHHSILPAAVQGFLEGLRMKESRRQMEPVQVAAFVQAVGALSAAEIEALLRRQLDEIRREDDSDYAVILRSLRAHARELHDAIRSVLQAVFSA